MSDIRDYLGDFKPGFKLPADIARMPLDQPESVARLYCNACGAIYELTTYQLTQYLGMAGAIRGTEYPVEQFDGKKSYVLTAGCHVCSQMPMPAVESIEDAPDY